MSDQNSTAQVVPFTYEATELRSFVIDGQPWFVAADVARILEYSATAAMTRRLDDDDKGVRRLHTPGGEQEFAIITEAGFYEAVIGSQCPKAKDVKRWLSHEVLPAIRKTGTYSTAPKPLTLVEQMARGLQAAEQLLAEKDEVIAELAPKAALADDYLIAEGGSRLVGQAAKLLGMKEKELRRFLLDEKLTFVRHAPCGVIQYDHYSQYALHFKATEHVVNHTHGSCSHYTLRILPRGMELIAKRRGQIAVSA